MATRPTHAFARKAVVLYLVGMVWHGDIAHQVATLLMHAQPEVQIACQMVKWSLVRSLLYQVSFGEGA